MDLRTDLQKQSDALMAKWKASLVPVVYPDGIFWTLPDRVPLESK